MLKKSLLKKSIAVCMTGALALSALAITGCTSPSSNTSSASSAASSAKSSATSTASDKATMTGIHHATLEVEGYEPITVTLDADSAPITVTNFVDLVEDGYYDGLTFYRIQDGFVMQGGTKGNTASGNDPSLTKIVGEFSSNDYENPLADAFDYGTIAMARTNDPDSATSTFFITTGEAASDGSALDGAYAAFGTIDEAGMATVEKIIADHLANVDDPSMGMISDEANQPVIKSITIVD